MPVFCLDGCRSSKMDKLGSGKFYRSTLTLGEFVGLLLLPSLLNVVLSIRFDKWLPYLLQIKVNASTQLHSSEKWLPKVKVITRKNQDSPCFLSRQSMKDFLNYECYSLLQMESFVCSNVIALRLS